MGEGHRSLQSVAGRSDALVTTGLAIGIGVGAPCGAKPKPVGSDTVTGGAVGNPCLPHPYVGLGCRTQNRKAFGMILEALR